MNKAQKIILPFFPDNAILRKHWWHRLSLILFSALNILLLIIALSSGYNAAKDISYSKNLPSPLKLSLLPGFEKMWKVANPNSTFLTDEDYLKSYYASEAATYEKFVLLSVLLFLGSNLIYRIILFVATNEDWKGKVKNK